MREQQRVTFGRLDRPKIHKLDDEAVRVEDRRAGRLARIVKVDRGARIFADEPVRDWEVPTEFAVLHREIYRKRNEKSVGHGIDEGRTLLDGELLLVRHRIEGFLRHRLVPVGQAEYRRNWLRNQRLVFRRAPKLQLHLNQLVHPPMSLTALAR